MNTNKSTEAPTVPAHTFGGIDGRCFDCDVRPYSRAAAEPCLDLSVHTTTVSDADWDAYAEMTYVDPAERA